jgi:lipopolysaccharide transport system permease protein
MQRSSKNKSSVSLSDLFSTVFRNRQLIVQMIRREVVSRYRGSIFGLAWSFLNPMLMLAVYTFVFSVVFKSRWGADPNESRTEFAVVLFVGMIVFGFFAEIFTRAPKLIVSNVNYVKKVVFPLEILSWVALGSALFHSLVSLAVLIVVQLLLNHSLPWTIIFLPLVLLPLMLASLGLSWFLASLGVFVRDINQLTNVLTTVLMFTSAVFYPLSSLPDAYQRLLSLNPLALVISESRQVLIYGQLPNWFALGLSLLLGMVVAFTGFWWFQKTRNGFADVL